MFKFHLKSLLHDFYCPLSPTSAFKLYVQEGRYCYPGNCHPHSFAFSLCCLLLSWHKHRPIQRSLHNNPCFFAMLCIFILSYFSVLLVSWSIIIYWWSFIHFSEIKIFNSRLMQMVIFICGGNHHLVKMIFLSKYA